MGEILKNGFMGRSQEDNPDRVSDRLEARNCEKTTVRQPIHLRNDGNITTTTLTGQVINTSKVDMKYVYYYETL